MNNIESDDWFCEKIVICYWIPFFTNFESVSDTNFCQLKNHGHPDSWDLAGFIARRKLGFVLTDIWMDEDPSIENFMKFST